MSYMIKRPRRNRSSSAVRDLVQETTLSKRDLVAPFFVLPGERKKEAIPTMPGVFRLTGDLLLDELSSLWGQGLCAAALFPVIPSTQKDARGSEALNPKGLIPCIIKKIKEALPELCLFADVALDPYTSHGHDGLINEKGEVLNDPSVEVLAQMSLVLAEAGADFVAPSDMMDGRVKAIRHELCKTGFTSTGILSYTAKYASSLYAPFRDALHSAPAFGDKKTYQMNPANAREALLEATLDEEEGADMLMVKPALFYLDIIAKLRQKTNLPICAYLVSGEYAMVMAAHEKGMLDASRIFYEAHLSIKRAGADFIFSYATPHLLSSLRER